MIKTKIDALCEFLEEKEKTIDECATALGESKEKIEEIAKFLEKLRIIEIKYQPIGAPALKLLKKFPFIEERIPRYDEKYSFNIHGINATVYIYISEEKRPFYHLHVERPGPYTIAFLEEIKNEIAKRISFEVSYFLTPEKIQEYLPIVKEKIKEQLSRYFDKDLEQLAGFVFIDLYGMGSLEIFTGDQNLEEIVVNNSTLPISVYHIKYGWMKTNISIPNEEKIANISSQIARRIGEQISISKPILDAYLTTGDRAAATLYPISTSGNTITIRKFAREPWTVTKFIQNHTASLDMAAFLWQAIHYEANYVVTGGTASGKTSMLNVLSHLIPNYQRVITIEETREIILPEHIWNWVPLLTRKGGPETQEITMADLLTASLRLRPDRVILGEIRTPKEAEVLFDAIHTGHSVSTTMHADTATQLIKRLLEPPFRISQTEVESLHLIIVQHRDRRRNIRRTFEISEIIPGAAGTLATNRLFIWRPRTDSFEKVNEPRRYIEEINLYTGMTEREIVKDIEERKKILEWMTRKGYFELDKISTVARYYYNMYDELMEKVENDKELEEIEKSELKKEEEKKEEKRKRKK
jgi:flagellar protein FlaI